MDAAIVAMLLAAALLHSSWHALIQSSGDRLVALAGMNAVSVAFSLAALPFVAVPEAGMWWVFALSIVLHNAYKLALAALYGRGGLGSAYPLGRGFTPLFAMLIAFVALHEVPTASQLCAVLLTCGGLACLALEQWKRGGTGALLGSAALVGLAVAGYTVLDAYGARVNGDWLSFVVWLMVLDGTTFVLLLSATKGRALWSGIAADRRRTLVSGVLGVAAFMVLLWALGRGPVGGVSALRETSVLFTALIGSLFLGERWSALRLAGAALVCGGIALFALG